MASIGKTILQTGLVEQQFEVAAQVVDALGSNLGAMPGFGQNERALDGGLRVKGQAFGGPIGMHTALAHGFFDVRDEGCGVAAYTAVAGFAQIGVRVVDFLHHGSDQAGKVGQIAEQNVFAEIDVREQSIEGIGVAPATIAELSASVVMRRCSISLIVEGASGLE